MLTILHGENIVQSRNQLYDCISKAKNNEATVVRYDAQKLELKTIESSLGTHSLFNQKKCIIIEKLHSLPRSKRKNELIKCITQYTEHNDTVDVILWEKRDLTKTMLKKFPHARAKQYKLSSAVFTWLDACSPTTQKKSLIQKLQTAIQQDSEGMCFYMLARQIRLLLTAKDGGKISGPPFIQAKIRKQAHSFTLKKLLQLHESMTHIDFKMKTSTSALSLQHQLEYSMIQL